MSEPSPPSYAFGPFAVDAGRRLLLRDGQPLVVAPKVLETLLALIEHRDRIVTKDELLRYVWGETIVEEGGLARNISVLRKALGETPDDHHYIVTVPARGYRFVAEVRETASDEALDASPQAGFPWRRWLPAAAVMVLAIGALTYVLRPIGATESGRPVITALAVLPFDNLSGDPAQDYFADGVTEALIGNLARIHALRVVSRTSVMRFKGARASLPDIARALNVDAVIEGSVQRTSERVRISVQLIHASTDAHLWAREYERPLTDILTLQSDVARAVAEEIRIQVTAEERARIASAGTINPAAHHEYLVGQYHLWKLTEHDLARAIECFERATRLDPGYAAAYAGLSHAWWWRGIHGAKTFKEIEPASRAAAQKALQLDERLAEAHVSLGRIKFGHDWDWAGAEKDFGRALEIDPNNLDAHFFHTMLFMALGRFSESIAHIDAAATLDPLSPTVQSAFGRILYRAHRFDEAIARLNQAIALEPRDSGAVGRLADVYEVMGRYGEALALRDKYDSLVNRPPRSGLETARLYARSGKAADARRILAASPPPDNKTVRAQVHVGLGEYDEAFRLLFAFAEERDTLNYVNTDPQFDLLHSDPRWPLLLRRMNFPVRADTH